MHANPVWLHPTPLQDGAPAASYTIQFMYQVDMFGRLMYGFQQFNTSVAVNETYALHTPQLDGL